jgi:outer membrane protein TolC
VKAQKPLGSVRFPGRDRTGAVKKILSFGLCCAFAASTALAQQDAIAPIKPNGFLLTRPYKTPEVPNVRMGNSLRLQQLIRGGNLYLTVQDAIALALENNIDLESNRYNALTDQWLVQRQEAGGPLPGVPSGSSQASSNVSGQGAAGSQQAAGIRGGGGGSGLSNNTVGATISQIGPTTPTLDPVFQETDSFSHSSQPQAIKSSTGVTNYIQDSRKYNTAINQGLITGGQISLSQLNSYLSENSPNDVLNPTNADILSFSLQHNLLQGFGVAVNSRNITVAKRNIAVNDLNFKTTVIGVVVNVLNQYYSLVADYQDLSAKRGALEVAQKLAEDNKKQVQIGTMTPLDVTQAEAQVATSQQDVSTSQATLEQQEVSLKNLLSRNGLADPLIRDAQIIPLDTITVPEHDDLPPLQQLIKTAYSKRADLAAEKMNIENSQTSALGTKNGVLPQLAVIVDASAQGQAGTKQYVPVPPDEIPFSLNGPIPAGFEPCPPSKGGPSVICEVPNPYFVGGLGNAMGQMIRRNFPSQSVGAYVAPTLRNRQAQADYAIDQLSLRQQELESRRHVNQVAVDVSNQVVALQQARVRYQAAVKNRELQQQLLIAEQKKFALGASTTFLVVQQQRDLSAAQATEIADLVAYSNARISLNQTLGTTLEAAHVSIQDAQQGRITRQSSLPSKLPLTPKIQ